MLIAAVNPWFIIAPALLAQYGLAVFCLTRLAYCKLSVRAYVLWNLLILLVFFVGSFVFLIYYFCNRTRLRITKAELEPQPDPIVADAPTGEERPDAQETESAGQSACGTESSASETEKTDPS